MQTIVTHSGSFDPDDVLAVASLQLYLGVENTKIIRSREEKKINEADWVVDVGERYDPVNRLFDHHQNGVPTRDNNVPYSAFGLIWKEFGEKIAGSPEVAAYVEKKIVWPIDAADNHITVCHPGHAEVVAFEFFDVIDAFKPVWGTEEDFDAQFLEAVTFARQLIQRFIAHAGADIELQQMIRKKYELNEQKVILEFSEHIPRHALVGYEHVQVVVSPAPAKDVDRWMAAVVPVRHRGFQNRAVFPETWAGLAYEELESISGIDGAIFCHKERYVFIAETKEAAMKAAHHART